MFDNNHQLLATRGLSNNELSIFSISVFNADSCSFHNGEFFAKGLERNSDLE
jgi:hypothetical protein